MKTFGKQDVVLLAYYSEWLKDMPDFIQVNHATLGMEKPVYDWAIAKLETMGLIRGVEWSMDSGEVRISRNSAVLTREGVKWAEELLGINCHETAESWIQMYSLFKGLDIPLMAKRIARNVGIPDV